MKIRIKTSEIEIEIEKDYELSFEEIKAIIEKMAIESIKIEKDGNTNSN